MRKTKKITDRIERHDFINYEMVGGPNSYQSIVDQIEKQKYGWYYDSISKCICRLMNIDYAHGVPSIYEFFYGFYGTFGHLMDWDDLIEEYKKKYMVSITPYSDDKTFKHDNPKYHYTFTEEQLDNKILKTYMSFLKEQHYMHWLYNHGLTSACWSAKRDISDGLDVIVQNFHGKEYGTKIWADTPAGRYYAREKKDSRHDNLEALYRHGTRVLSIPIPVGKDKGNLIGDTNVVEEEVLKCAYGIITLGIEPITIERDKVGPNNEPFITRELVLRRKCWEAANKEADRRYYEQRQQWGK